MKLKNVLMTGILAMALLSCGEDPVPKPKAMLRLEYPAQAYRSMQSDCPFLFDYNRIATPDLQEGCNMILDYKAMKGSIYLT